MVTFPFFIGAEMKIKSLFFVLIMFANCATPVDHQMLNPATYYKNDICFEYTRDLSKHPKVQAMLRNNETVKFEVTKNKQQIKFCGVGVLPYDESYALDITGYGKMNFFSMNTCHREITSENPDSGLFKKNGEIKINYKPTLEMGKACPLFIASYNRKGKHSWGVVAVENPGYTLNARIECNGDIYGSHGVGICQAKAGLLQKISFEENVFSADPADGPAERKDPCPKLGRVNKSTFEFMMPPRECVYGFIGVSSGKEYKFYTVGYERLIVRE